MDGIGWISFLFVGLIAGWIAEKVMRRNHGLLRNLIVGVIGAYLGAILFSAVGLGPAENFWGALVVATIGAIVLLGITGVLLGRR
jgi:uncharacterized membrane protein YeaQ/YmgE (transglycosylase-associated protein family)